MAYIDREKLLKDIEESVVFTVRGQNSLEIKGANKVIDRIKQMPTADVVEIIRCKDCVHKIITSKGRTMCKRNASRMGSVADWYGLVATEDNHFCSHGERKEVN